MSGLVVTINPNLGRPQAVLARGPQSLRSAPDYYVKLKFSV